VRTVDTRHSQVPAPAIDEVLGRAAAQPSTALRQEQSGSLIFRRQTILRGGLHSQSIDQDPVQSRKRNEGTSAVLYLRALPAEFLKWEDPNKTFSGLASMQAGSASDRLQRAAGLQASTGMALVAGGLDASLNCDRGATCPDKSGSTACPFGVGADAILGVLSQENLPPGRRLEVCL
jgi:hypothetical protein